MEQDIDMYEEKVVGELMVYTDAKDKENKLGQSMGLASDA